MLRPFITTLLILASSQVVGDAAIRPNSLVFNQTYALTTGAVASAPLYLTRRGEYYAEAILERPDGTERPLAVDIALNIQIDRNDKVLLERAISTTLGRERPTATLFWLSSDRELPIKTPLNVVVSIDAVQLASSDAELRIQIKRKPNLGVPILR